MDILSRYTGRSLFSGDYPTIKTCLEAVAKTGADLTGAQRGQHTVGIFGHLTFSGAWYRWGYAATDDTLRLEAGCHTFELSEARAYWAGKEDRRETLAALDYFEAVMKIRGWRPA